MIVRRSAFVLAVVVASLLGGITPSASAQPSVPPTDENFIDPQNSCFYDLTPPELVILPGGAKAVTATIVAVRCTGSAQTTTTNVCVATPDGPGDCGGAEFFSFDVIEVFVTAPRYDGPFTARGLGCWRVLLEEFQEKCRTLGPVTTTF